MVPGRYETSPRPATDGEMWAGTGDEAAKEPHGPNTIYLRGGMLEVALDCGQHVKEFFQKDVFNGTIDTTCDLSHQKRATK
jgi:hypothetical protein